MSSKQTTFGELKIAEHFVFNNGSTVFVKTGSDNYEAAAGLGLDSVDHRSLDPRTGRSLACAMVDRVSQDYGYPAVD
jgi:hypothetical protein